MTVMYGYVDTLFMLTLHRHCLLAITGKYGLPDSVQVLEITNTDHTVCPPTSAMPTDSRVAKVRPSSAETEPADYTHVMYFHNSCI